MFNTSKFDGLILIFFVFFVGSSTQAVELYTDRPDILNVKSQTHNRDFTWNALKEGHLEAVAQILGLYPDREIFFLARDGELLYDLARLFSHELQDSRDLNRLHLINVSRLSKSSPHVKAYLEQQGLKEENLRNGNKVLLVDTGFEGSIPKAMQEVYPQAMKSHIDCHLMCSSNQSHPSSRVFLLSLNALADQVNPATLHGTIISYEHRPRYTNRADRYIDVAGTWVPAAPLDGSTSDGSVCRVEALKDMEDLKAYALNHDVQKRFMSRKAFWRELHGYIVAKNKAKILDVLNSDELKKSQQRTAIVRDTLETMGTNLGRDDEQLLDYWPEYFEVGLLEITDIDRFHNKQAIIQLHPEWKPFIEDPSSGIALLFKNGDFHTLRAIADVLHDEEFKYVLAKSIAKHAVKPSLDNDLREMTKALLKNGDDSMRKALIRTTFCSKNVILWKQELSLLISYCNWQDMEDLIRSVFTEPHTASWSEQLGQLLNISSSFEFHFSIIYSVFSKEHSKSFKKELCLIIEKTPDIFGDFFSLRGAFSQNMLSDFRLLLKLLILISDQRVRCNTARLFAHPESIACDEELYLLIILGDQEVRKKLAEKAFNSSFGDERTHALQLLIEKGNFEVDLVLLTKVFREEYAHVWKPQLFSILTRAHEQQWPKIIECMKDFQIKPPISSRGGGRRISRRNYHPFKNAIMTAAGINDMTERKKYLQDTLGVSENPKPQGHFYKKQGVFFSGKIYNSLQDIQRRLERQWLKQDIVDNPKAMAVIVDNDGTLTQKRQDALAPYQQRDGAGEFLGALNKANVTVLISSAHNDYGKTLKKLGSIGALSALGMSTPQSCPLPEVIEINQRNIYDHEHTKAVFEKYEFEKVVSMRLKGKDDDFVRKAYALISLPETIRNNLKKIFLVDDSLTIIRTFIKDIHEFAPGYLPALEQVKIYQLQKSELAH
jgi:hypothetical protein